MAFELITDTELLSMMIYGEARGESTVGKLAVAKVAINRSKHPAWWGKTLRECILKPKQFSCFNANDPNSHILLHMAQHKEFNLACLVIAELALSPYTIDPSCGATHYHTESIQPEWSLDMSVTSRIGNHVFLRECSRKGGDGNL